MRRVSPSIIHANGFDLSRSFALAARVHSIPYLTHVRFPLESAGMRWVLRGLPKPAAFIFNSHAMKRALWKEISRCAPRSSAYVIHNAVDLSTFTPAPWPGGPPYRVGIVANFAGFKRHEDFLRMGAEMLRTRQDLEVPYCWGRHRGRWTTGSLGAARYRLGYAIICAFPWPSGGHSRYHEAIACPSDNVAVRALWASLNRGDGLRPPSCRKQ